MTNLFLLEKFVSIVMMYLSTLLWPGGSGVGQFSQLTSSDEKYSAGWPGASSVTELDRRERERGEEEEEDNVEAGRW